MKQKEVEDVFGGKEEFANADTMASKSLQLCLSASFCCHGFRLTVVLFHQLNALAKIVLGTAHITSSCRFGVRMSL